jgi:nucleotide-binding universal stress UspA family protein
MGEKKEDVMELFHRILVATDFSEASTPAFQEAILIAKENGAELLIANAYHPPNVLEADSVAFGVYEEWDRNLRVEIEGKLNALVEEARKAGVAARPLILPGAPHEAITGAAKENDADLVIMGTHGRKGVSRLFLGSVASRVIATAPCPVMTIHAV